MSKIALRRGAQLCRARRRPRGGRDPCEESRAALGSGACAAVRRVQGRRTGRASSSAPSAGCSSTAATRTLLHALGRLCERQQLWGKAQTYYEASLALDDGWRAHVALGEMLARLGSDTRGECAPRGGAEAGAERADTRGRCASWPTRVILSEAKALLFNSRIFVPRMTRIPVVIIFALPPPPHT